MNTAQLISEAVASGKVRKFTPGESGFIDGIQVFLRERGILLYQHKNKYIMKRDGHKGRPAGVAWEKVLREVDRIRLEEGLQPLRVSHHAASRKASK